jgi:hypothetical protein
MQKLSRVIAKKAVLLARLSFALAKFWRVPADLLFTFQGSVGATNTINPAPLLPPQFFIVNRAYSTALQQVRSTLISVIRLRRIELFARVRYQRLVKQ